VTAAEQWANLAVQTYRWGSLVFGSPGYRSQTNFPTYILMLGSTKLEITGKMKQERK